MSEQEKIIFEDYLKKLQQNMPDKSNDWHSVMSGFIHGWEAAYKLKQDEFEDLEESKRYIHGIHSLLNVKYEELKDENEKLHKACEMWMKEASKNNGIYYECSGRPDKQCTRSLMVN
jgi:hypothetical protein